MGFYGYNCKNPAKRPVTSLTRVRIPAKALYFFWCSKSELVLLVQVFMLAMCYFDMSNSKLLDSYLQYRAYVGRYKINGKLDLSGIGWAFPSLLLLLRGFIHESRGKVEVILPENKSVRKYVSLMLDESTFEKSGETYCPFVELPRQKVNAERILQKLYAVRGHGDDLGGEAAFKYILGELTDNIYEHSQFTTAFVMAKRYPKLGFAEICFFDNGLTIPGCLEKHEVQFASDAEAIGKALNGLSTKGKERGYGLSTSLSIATKPPLKGDALIISRRGGIEIYAGKQQAYELPDPFQGTFVAIQIPLPSKAVNIYDYVSGQG